MAAVLAALAIASPARAQEEESPYSFTGGVDFSSHFISYGADVWAGGDGISPFGADSTTFIYGTLTTKFTDELSVFVNIWTDNNDNVNSEIGGWIQEIDVNTGVNYSLDKFTFSVTHGFWIYAGDEEKILDFAVTYNDADMIADGFSLNPNATVHWRYDGNGGQEEGVILNLGLRPAFVANVSETFKPTIQFPMSVGWSFDDGFHGGDDGLAYANVGVSSTIPLGFIPERFGSWSVTPSVTYWYTPDDVIPGNPEESFFVTAISFNAAF